MNQATHNQRKSTSSLLEKEHATYFTYVIFHPSSVDTEFILEYPIRASNVAQQIRVPATTLDLSSVPRLHMIEGENQLSQVVL